MFLSGLFISFSRLVLLMFPQIGSFNVSPQKLFPKPGCKTNTCKRHCKIMIHVLFNLLYTITVK